MVGKRGFDPIFKICFFTGKKNSSVGYQTTILSITNQMDIVDYAQTLANHVDSRIPLFTLVNRRS
ncbi:MAG: hypothetical protein K9W44_15165 [Candidatus Lokiarchaeota archaeon]|nr:hypothetical protein [Candidatus Harpocratesius repetitus]